MLDRLLNYSSRLFLLIFCFDTNNLTDRWMDYPTGRISIVLNTDWNEPYTNKTEDVEAADRATQFKLGWFANPIFVNGDYPDVMKEYIGRKSQEEGRNTSRLPEFTPVDKLMILGIFTNII